jgi:ankyrin repeat protein
MKYGVGPDGNALAEKPADIELLIDWVKPGGPRNRENCVKMLIHHGANIHDTDYQGFTILHFAAMWGTFWFVCLRVCLRVC